MGWGLDFGQYGIAVGDIDPLMAPGDRNVLGAGSSRFSPIQLHRAFHDLLGDCSSHPAGATQEDASGHGSAQTSKRDYAFGNPRLRNCPLVGISPPARLVLAGQCVQPRKGSL